MNLFIFWEARQESFGNQIPWWLHHFTGLVRQEYSSDRVSRLCLWGRTIWRSGWMWCAAGPLITRRARWTACFDETGGGSHWAGSRENCDFKGLAWVRYLAHSHCGTISFFSTEKCEHPLLIELEAVNLNLNRVTMIMSFINYDELCLISQTEIGLEAFFMDEIFQEKHMCK